MSGKGAFGPYSPGGRPGPGGTARIDHEAWPSARSPADRAGAVVLPDLAPGGPGDRRVASRRLDRDPLEALRDHEPEHVVLLLALEQADLGADHPGRPVGAGRDLLVPALDL